MYIPRDFKISDEVKMFEIMEKNSFATVFSQHNGEPFATHLPLTLDKEEGCLFGHFARPNNQWKDIENQKVLVIFQGPHSYISPSWYETDKAVPTWNYVAVHVYGQMELVHDDQALYDSLRELVDKYEQPDSSYSLNKVNPDYIKGMSKGIVGFKIKITRMEGKAKLSQNHPVERQELVINQLEKAMQDNQKQMAELMRNNLIKRAD